MSTIPRKTSRMEGSVNPVTRGCLDLLGALPAGGPFVDLGCGDGEVAVMAARLGFTPVLAVDIRPEAALSTLAAAVSAGVAVECRLVDLLMMPAPFAPIVCAHVPAGVHAAIAARMEDWPDHLIASGFDRGQLDVVSDGYARLGLAPRRTIGEMGWIACLFER
jgi:ribosomal protein L11 methyltransferase